MILTENGGINVTVKDFISKILDSYQEITINEYDDFERIGRRWIIEPHSKDYRHIPDEIWNQEIRAIIPYYDEIFIDVEVQ